MLVDGAADHLCPPSALLGNGRPTVHGSLLEIGGLLNGCKCGVESGSAEIAAANGATIQRTSSRDDDEREAVEKANN